MNAVDSGQHHSALTRPRQNVATSNGFRYVHAAKHDASSLVTSHALINPLADPATIESSQGPLKIEHPYPATHRRHILFICREQCPFMRPYRARGAGGSYGVHCHLVWLMLMLHR